MMKDSIGMERLKQPAGRLATVFYCGLNSKQSSSRPASKSSDQESGTIDLDAPPVKADATTRERSAIMEYQPRNLTWTGLNFDVKTKEGQKRLLSDLNGSVYSGQLKALMGVSGAGKTTLLNALAGRSRGTLTGTLALNGQLLPKSFNRHMGYVQQQDIYLPTQSVREALQMTARLRRPREISLEEKDSYVEEIIRSLDMESIADALIGTPGAGLNLEQRKRVSIGVEMAAKPDILFLDEPTSGLDGQSAYSIVRLLRRLADSGQAIICTVHQPAAELIAAFDELYLLAHGGQVVYDGPLGVDCQHAVAHFASHARPCREKENPAEYFLEVIGAGTRQDVQTDWVEMWKQRRGQSSAGQNALASSSAVDSSRNGGDHLQLSLQGAPFHDQLLVLLKRTWLYYWRAPDYARAKLWLNAGNALLNGMTYLNSPSTQRGAYNRVFSSFMSMIVGPPLGLQVQPRFLTLRNIFEHRERESMTYHWLAFSISAILIELPYAFVTSLVYWLLWYFPTGYFRDSNHAGYSFLMYQLFSVFATSLAQLCASLMPTVEAALTANGFFFMFCNTFAGTLSPAPVTPQGWRWYYTVSPLFYMNEGVVADVLHDLPLHCAESEVSVFQPPVSTTCYQYAASFLQNATGFLVNPNSTVNCEYCRYKNGQAYVSPSSHLS